jgi:hypothetical protein
VTALPIKEDENVIFEDREEVAQLLPIVLEGVWITPELEKGTLA